MVWAELSGLAAYLGNTIYVPTKYGPKTRILATDKARRSIVIMKGSVPGSLSAYNNHGPQLKWSGDIIAKLVVGCRPRRSAPSHDPRDIERNPSQMEQCFEV